MVSDRSHARGFRFGVFELDLTAAELRRDGLLVRLRGKPFDILSYLLERPGELVTRDELRQRLWLSDTFVDFDHGLNAAVNRLRETLGDSAENPRFIQTVPRRGYRFIAPVERLARGEKPAAAPATPLAVESAPPQVAERRDGFGGDRLAWLRSGLLGVGGVLLVALLAAVAWMTWFRAPASPPSDERVMLAVLPFANLSGDTDQDFFSEGMTDELIAQLGALRPEALGIIARTTVAHYLPGKQTIGEIGRELGVQYVLEGSVRRSGPRVRINAQLVAVATQTQLWTETYDHDLQDILLTQRDVAERVAESLARSVLRGRTVPRLPSAAAYEAYLRGRYFRQQATEVSLGRAIEHFEEAIELDPTYAAAYAGLADVYHVLGGPGWEFGAARDLLPRAAAAAARAIELDPNLPDGYAVRGMSRLWLDWNATSSEEDQRRAISLNPSFAQAHQYLSTALIVQGRVDDAIAAARRAAELDPLSPAAGTTLGYRLYYARRYGEALAQFSRTLEIASEFASAHLGQAQALRELRRDREALAAFERAGQFSGGRTYIRAHLAHAYAMAGRREEAREIQRQLVDLQRARYVSPYDLSLVAAGMGDQDAMLVELSRAFADRSGWMVFVAIEREFAPHLVWPPLTTLLERVRPDG